MTRENADPQSAGEPTPAEINPLVAMINTGRYVELETHARGLIGRYPASGLTWKILSLSLSRQGKDPLQALESAAKHLPHDAEAHSNLGNALRGAGRVEEALSAHRRALTIMPSYAEGHNNLGSALQDLGRLDEAATSYRRAIELQPHFAIAHANLGNALLDKGQPEAAVASYQRALEIKPDFLAVLVRLGGALRDLGQAHAAEIVFREALKLLPNSAELHHNLAVVLKLQNHAAEAEASCRKALELNPKLVAALVFLGSLQVGQGDFAEAEALFKRAISIEPGSSEAWSGLPKLRKMTSADSVWLIEAQRLADRHPAPRQEIHLRYAMGKYFDDVNEFAQAFGNYRRANELTKLLRPPHDRQQLSRFVDRIIQSRGQSPVQRARNESASRRPVFIVGMARSGTTLAEQILASHSSVFGAGELPFWGMALARSLAEPDDRCGETGVRLPADDYLQLLETLSADAHRVVDKMPTNFFAIGLIHAALPNARFIHMRRNPIDTCLSIYFQDFETAYSYASDLEDLAHAYAEYVRIMNHWRSVLGEGVILDVSYEGLVEDQELWSRRMLEFIDVPWDPECLNFHQTRRIVSTVSSWQVRQAINTSSIERWRNYERFVEPLVEPLSRFATLNHRD